MQICVIAKEPRPGFVKTRLTPPCTPTEAAAIAEAALADTLDAVLARRRAAASLALDGRARAVAAERLRRGAATADGGLDQRLGGRVRGLLSTMPRRARRAHRHGHAAGAAGRPARSRPTCSTPAPTRCSAPRPTAATG